MASELYIGVMSGTSHDGLDAALVAIDGQALSLIGTEYLSFSDQLRQQLLDFNHPDNDRSLDQILPAGREFSALVNQLIETLLDSCDIKSSQITAVGCHGHTLRHRPDGKLGYSYQLVDGAALAITCGIPVVCDFRSGDIALGGTGAPLAPAFHRFMFSSDQEHRIIANIGGIANITLLPLGSQSATGLDTGPGNLLMDYCAERFFDQRYDDRGAIARQGIVEPTLLKKLLNHDYFKQPAPKSTGREVFNSEWLISLNGDQIEPHSLLTTLTELTARSLTDEINKTGFRGGSVLVCGGGSHNDYLLERIQHYCNDWKINTTLTAGFDPDWIEAAAFAWLARQRWHRLPGNLTSVTGAKRETILGAVYLP